MKKIILVLCLIFLIVLTTSCTKISDSIKGISGSKELPKNTVEVKESFVVEDDQDNELKIVVQ